MDLVRTSIERYVKLTDPEWAEVEPCWKRYSFAKGEFISHAGRVETRAYIVEHGVQRMYHEHDGNEHCLGFAYGNSWSGDYDSFVGQRPGRFQVQALTESSLVGIERIDLLRLYDRIPAMDPLGSPHRGGIDPRPSDARDRTTHTARRGAVPQTAQAQPAFDAVGPPEGYRELPPHDTRDLQPAEVAGALKRS
jgi:hypothetical protein